MAHGVFYMRVTLSGAKGLSVSWDRCLAALGMTGRVCFWNWLSAIGYRLSALRSQRLSGVLALDLQHAAAVQHELSALQIHLNRVAPLEHALQQLA